MEYKNIYKDFINNYLNEDEVNELFSLFEAEDDKAKAAEDGLKQEGMMDTLARKGMEKVLAKSKKIEQNIKDGKLDEKEILDLVYSILYERNYILSPETIRLSGLSKKMKHKVYPSVSIPKEKRQELFNKLSEYKKEKIEERKRRLVKGLAFSAISLIKDTAEEIEKIVKKNKIIKTETGENIIVPTKGKHDQIKVKQEIVGNLVPQIKALDKKVSEIKKIFSDLEFANSGESSITAPLVKVKKFNSLTEVANFMAKVYSLKYLEEFFAKNNENFSKTYREAKDLIIKTKEKGKKPENYLNTDQWVAIFLKKLKDHNNSISILSPKEIENIIVAIEEDNIEGLKIAGKFILSQLEKLMSHGRNSPYSK